jgi:glutathione peroxidase
MKTIYTLTLSLLMAFSLFSKAQDSKASTPLYDIQIDDIHGNPINLSEFKGKKILFVNVASKCGFTPQYKDLEMLHDLYKDQLVLIGLPCNQFGSQEPGTNEEIVEFCSATYGVSFLMTDKIEVKGENQHPLYTWLTSKELNGKKCSTLMCNFKK